MSSVNSLGSTFTDATTLKDQTAGSAVTKEIGRTEFLELLVTQLKHQDPMDPVNNEEFIAQMAAFSSLEQLISINEGISKLSGSIE